MSKRNKRFNWSDDWREWFGPKTYGIGWTVKSWKGVLALGAAIALIVLITIGVTTLVTNL